MNLRLLSCLVILTVATTAASAQTPSQPAKPRTPVVTKAKKDPKWTFEVFGGGAFGGGSGGDVSADFPAGEAFTTEGGFPSRAVPSWYFGDGARLFNEVRAQFATRYNITIPQLVALDPIFADGIIERSGGAAFGVRLTRQLSPRYTIEFALYRSQGALHISDSAGSAIETSRESFDQALTGLLSTIPQAGLQVTSTADMPEEVSASETAITAVVNMALGRTGARLTPYVSAGIGQVSTDAETVRVRLTGNYQFRFLDTNPFNETDTVTLRSTPDDSSIIGVFGGGALYALTPRQGLRFDVRVHAGEHGLVTDLDAGPTAAGLTPALALPSITTPSIQFSNTAQFKTSLSGRINDQTIFTGSGVDMRVHLSVGYFFRF